MSKRVNKKDNGQEVDGQKLTGDQNMVLLMLLNGKTQREAAAAVGVAEETVSRWMNHNPDFMAAYNAGVQSLFDASINELLELRRKAVKTIGDMMERGEGRNKLRAAEKVLKYTTRPEGETEAATIAKQQRWDETFSFSL